MSHCSVKSTSTDTAKPTAKKATTGRAPRVSARQLRNRADQLLAVHADLLEREAAMQVVSDEELGRLEQRAQHARELLEQAEAARRDAQERLTQAQERSGLIAALAARALPLLSATCPVCEQSIDERDVTARLRRLIEQDGEDLTGLQTSFTRAGEATRTMAAEFNLLEVRLSEMRTAQQHAKETSANRVAWLETCRQLAIFTNGVIPAEKDHIRDGDPEALRRLRDSADHLAGVADELVAVLGASTLGEQTERQRAALEDKQARAETLRAAAAAASQRAEDATTLRNATTRATAAVTASRFAQLQPLVNDFFGRLDPHPVFTTLRFELDVSYRVGVADPVVEDDEGVGGDPLLVFSSSQANVAALTYFLALSWTAEDHALPFLLLDDPLQSMDAVNILGFSDLCRHIRRRRQLIVSTHEQRLADLLERKLAPRGDGGQLRVIRFAGWDRSGPKIDSHIVESHNDIGYLLGTS